VRWWSTTVRWRNWPLPVKLGLVLVVPVVGALVLGVLRVQGDASQAGMYRTIERIATLRAQLVTTVTSIEDERNAAVRRRDLARLAAVTDTATKRTTALVGNTGDLGPVATQRLRNLTGALSLLPYARGQVAAGADGIMVVIAYNAVANAVLAFDRALVGRFPDEELTGSSIALNELQSAREQVGIQQAAGLAALRAGTIGETDRSMIDEADVRLDDNLSDFRAAATRELRTRYDTTVTGADVAKRQLLVLAARTPGGGAPPFTRTQWDTAFDATSTLMADVTTAAADELRTESAALAGRYVHRAGMAAILLLAMVLLAAGIGGVLGRHQLRSLRVLRRTALDVARRKLPAAVASIRAGDGESVRIEPVPVRTTEEFGQLARAFDAVHAQAVHSAVEEASLRANLADIFTNLSRRSQGLVERQLRLMEQLEQKEDDPDQLANLFKIDHLATRMRRNNENLMVLSGAGLGRRFTEPMPLPDVLRSAVSEVEHYQRVIIRAAPAVRVLGYAAGDLIRSVSELIENATRFSPPECPVEVAGRRADDGSMLIDILDEGVGMGESELRAANARVAAGGGTDIPVSRQMGLFVVGRLTARHGMRVRLARREAREGLRATLRVLASLVTGDPVRLPAPARPVEPISEPASAVAGRLRTAGIDVELPDVPAAGTSAAILFAAAVPAEPLDGTFTWLQRPGATAATSGETRWQVAPTSLMEPETGPNGLPKRVPKGELTAPPGSGPRQRGRDAERARGFLRGYQAGLRQNETRKGAGGT
jgi:signal transduction histidine kinase